MASQYFLPLAQELATLDDRRATPRLIGINGCQGSGKSTLAALLSLLLTNCYHLNVVNLSIDDFYLTQAARQRLAKRVHPLLATRGVPGTHDIALLQQTLAALCDRSAQSEPTAIVRFNKATDERRPQTEWDKICGPVDIIFLEGWCVGTGAQTAQALSAPVNELEAKNDRDGQWRHYVNHRIETDYAPLFKQLQTLIMLQAPSFDCVYQWRQQQETQLRQHTAHGDGSGIMNSRQLQHFIQHYQRLTEHMLKHLSKTADIVFQLNSAHHIVHRHDNPS